MASVTSTRPVLKPATALGQTRSDRRRAIGCEDGGGEDLVTRYIVVGAGAIGGAIGGQLTIAGRDAVLVARGDHLAALRTCRPAPAFARRRPDGARDRGRRAGRSHAQA